MGATGLAQLINKTGARSLRDGMERTAAHNRRMPLIVKVKML
jgi:hypothetical protein